MARKSQDYWEKRQTELMLRIEKNTNDSIQRLIFEYDKAKKQIQKEIQKIFNKYAEDGKLTAKEAKKLLNAKESKEYYDNLLDKINTVKDKDIKRDLLSKYNAPAYNYRIARYQALQDNIDVELAKLVEKENIITQKHYIDTINESFYRTIYNTQQNLCFAFSFAQIDKRTVNLMLAENWYKSDNFSQRIWKNTNKLADYLKEHMLVDNIAGKSLQRISKELNDTMHIGLFNATRLIRTETNMFANEAEALAYEECEIEKYRFIATLDKVTCDECAKLDNKVFELKERKTCLNYPPMHPNDRCTTVAVFEDEEIEELERRARDENGKSILVPADMDYEEWKAKYIDMTDTEKGAIAEYSSSKAYTLNEKLRSNKKLNNTEQELVNNIDSGLNKLPSYNKVTYRQIGFDMQGKEEYNKFINQHKNNDFINYSQYISTSKNNNDYEVIDNLKVEIIIEGKTGKDIRGIAGIKEENEVLFGRNVYFEIIKVADNKIWLKEV